MSYTSNIHRLSNYRLFGSLAALYGGEWGDKPVQTGLDNYARAVHNWAFRDADLLWDSYAGTMSIVGHSQSSRWINYPGYPNFHPASIGIAGFSINDVNSGVAWGGYFDAIRDSDGFTVGLESSCANLRNETYLTPWNYLSGGASAGVSAWLQSGGGLDTVYEEYDRVNSIAAYEVYLSSFATAVARLGGGQVIWRNNQTYIPGRVAFDYNEQLNYCCLISHTSPSVGGFSDYRTANPSHWRLQKNGEWVKNTHYVAGDVAKDTISGAIFKCIINHVSGSSTFYVDRITNPTYWKQIPAAKKGRVITAGSLEEISAGSNMFIADEMPVNHKIVWSDSSGEPKTELYGSSYGLILNSYLTSIMYSNDSPNGGPYLSLARINKEAKNNDSISGILYEGYNNAKRKQTYVSEVTYILNSASGQETGEWAIAPYVNGTSTYAIKVSDGIKIGNPEGGYKGIGTINVETIYENGISLTEKYGFSQPLGSANTNDYASGEIQLSLSFSGSSSGIVYHSASATWSLYNNTVTINGSISLTSKGNAIGNAVINGLPYSAKSLGAGSIGYYGNLGINLPPILIPSGQSIALYKSGNYSALPMTNADFTDYSRIDFSITYHI